MYLAVLFLFCCFNRIIIIRADECDATNFVDNQTYNILGLYRHIYYSRTLKKNSALLASNRFNPSERDLDVEPHERLLLNSSKCVKDILYTFESLGNLSNLWALHLLDSFAKPPESGILQGNLKFVGDYNECVEVYAPPKEPGSMTGNFHGQYCSLSYSLLLHNNSLPLTFGICLPDSCSQKYLRDEVSHLLFKAGGFPVSSKVSSDRDTPITIICMPRERHLNTAAISVITVLSIFCTLTVAGSSLTVVKYFKKLLQEQKDASLILNISDEQVSAEDDCLSNVSLLHSSNSKGFLQNCEDFLDCFCVFKNGTKLLNTETSKEQLLCLHGIRFLSMSWVILGHTYGMGIQVSRNVLEMLDGVIDDFAFQIVLQGFFAVDSFFVLSGFLLSYFSKKEFVKRNGSMNWIYFYTHRYIRLTPIYMVVLGFSATVYFYLGSGPFWRLGDYDPVCRKTWWRNLLYINNFIGLTDQCMSWSWYLANDMQFFIISPIFLISLWRWPKVGYSLLGLSVVVSMLCNFCITYKFDLMAGVDAFLSTKNVDVDEFMATFEDYFQKLYIKPYTRIGPYLIGIVFGHLLFGARPKRSLISLCAGWIAACAATLTCVYGLYHGHPSLIARGLYNALSRNCFALGLSWVIYVCLTKQAGVVNSILSSKLFIPLSRLTYAAYLIHPLIILGYFNSLKRPFELSHPSVVVTYLGLMVMTYALSLPLSLIFESPIIRLEKWIRNREECDPL